MTSPTSTWLDHRHPDWIARNPHWIEATAHYRGEVFSPAYLIKRTIGENDDAYAERLRLADYAPHFAVGVDSLAGMALAADDSEHSWTWGSMGDPDDPNDQAYRLTHNVDGLGTSRDVFFKRWGFVSRVATPTGQGRAVLHLIPATAVINWWNDALGLATVIVREEEDTRSSIEDDPFSTERFLRLERGRWTRWTRDAQSGEIALREEGTYAFTDREGRARLPIFPISLPLDRHVGQLAARRCNAIFNMQSQLDHLLRNASFPFLNLHTDNDEQYNLIADEISEGGRLLQNPTGGKGHNFIAPPTDPAVSLTAALNDRRKDYYITLYREYGDAAAQKTATQINQDVASGVGAFLTLVVAAIESAMNQWLDLAGQAEVDNYDFSASVKLSREFTRLDIAQMLGAMTAAAFGDGAIPLGMTGQVQVAQQWAAYYGIELDEQQVERAVRVKNASNLVELYKVIAPIAPAAARAEMAMQVLDAMGVTDVAGMDRAGLLAESLTLASQTPQSIAAAIAAAEGSVGATDNPTSGMGTASGPAIGGAMAVPDAGRPSAITGSADAQYTALGAYPVSPV
jgi:hypothetical protein